MFFLLHSVLILFYIVAIIYTCQFFTNAIEHLGLKLKLGNSAIGSILAVVGTSLPETVVPLVAIFGAIFFKKNVDLAQDVALGAIIGSPFMLSTFALFVLGFSIIVLYIFKKRRKLYLDLKYENILRNCRYFLLAYIPAVLLTFSDNLIFKKIVVFYLITLYLVFVLRTLNQSKKNFVAQELQGLIILKFLPFFKKVNLFLILLQVFLSLLSLIIFSHFFVDEIEIFSKAINVSPLILSLIITPFATELPECVNSIIWIKSLKDDLAIANILGGVIFQATITFSVGILLTDWNLNNNLLINTFLVVICLFLFILEILLNKKITLCSLLICGLFYFLYIFFILLKNPF